MTINKVDSNITGLSYAEEASIGVLPGSPTWYGQEPNSYKDFGGNVVLTQRNPIVASRQQKKGSITDLTASGGWTSDLTADSHTRLMQGFFFADARQKAGTATFNGTQLTVSGVDGAGVYTVSSAPGFKVGDLVFCAGFAQALNNGVKKVTAISGATVTFASSISETPPASATMTVVGYQFGSAELTVDMSGSLPQLVRASGTKDFGDFVLVPGEWIVVGGDTSGTTFAGATNVGLARVHSATSTSITLDKTGATFTTDAGTSKTIQLFFGSVVKTEATSNLIKRRTYNLERTLGFDADGQMSEYVLGAVPDEVVLTLKAASKAEIETTFKGITTEQRTGLQAPKSGARVSPSGSECFNTASDFARIRMAIVNSTDAAPTPLLGFIMEATLTIKNAISPNKALGILGAFDMSAGNFVLDGKMTAYFGSQSAITSIRQNADVTLDIVMAKQNSGIVVDMPLIALGDGRANVAKDKPIELPLTSAAAQSSFGHTALWQHFPYLPTYLAP